MKRWLWVPLVVLCLAQLRVPVLDAQASDSQQPVVSSDAVLPTVSANPLLDPRIFTPEFYRKFNPDLNLATDEQAIQHWTSSGANHCLRSSFYFHAVDYLKRYPDLGLSPWLPGACDAAIRQFVTYGFNQGRIGAFESYPIVFDFNYYVDAGNNPNINQLYGDGTWDQVDVEIDWLQHGIAELRGASAFFNIKEYRERYPDVAGLSPDRALFQYVAQGQAQRRLGRALWADPSEWNALVATTQESVVTAASNDVVRNFIAANGKPTTVIVKSPKWFTSPSEPFPPSVHVCDVPPPNGNNDWNTLTTYLTPAGVQAGCDVVRLAPHSSYHLVLPLNQPPSLNYVLNHWPSLQINNVRDFVFDGNGSTLNFTGPVTGIDINNSQRVVVENLKLDWGSPVDSNALWRGPLFAAIGTIVADGTASAHIVLDADTPIPPGFSPYIYALNLWDREKKEVAADDYLNTGPNDQGCDYACIESHGQQDPSQQSMFFEKDSLYPKANPAGLWVASQLVPYPNRTVLVRFQEFWGMVIQDDYGSSDIRIINTSIFTSPYMGITAGQGGRGLSLENVVEKPSQGRPISTVADGSHFTGVGGDIVVEGGDFEREGDDVMNITVVWDSLTVVDSPNSFVMSGGDAIPNAGDTLAFFDAAFGYLGSSTVQSITPPNLPPWGGQPITVQLNAPLDWLAPGMHAINIHHVPSRVYVSNVNIHDKVGRGILLGGFHMLIQDSTFQNLTATAIASIPSSYFGESVGVSDVAIRNNSILRTNYVPKLFQSSVDGTSYYPSRDASIAMFPDITSNYDGVSSEVTGIYPLFQDIEISQNRLQSTTGAGIFLTGTKSVQIHGDQFTGCAAVPDADAIYSYFGSESKSALVLSFAQNVSATGDVTGPEPACTARTDLASSENVEVHR